MLQNQKVSRSLLLLGGIAGIVAIIFLPGVGLQIAYGWFPELALEEPSMTKWLETVTANQTQALTGIAFSIISILCFIPFSLTLYRLLPKDNWQTTLALAGHLIGVPLALVAFTMGFGFTWALIDLTSNSSIGDLGQIAAVAALGMRGYLVCDDLATCLIGVGNALYAWSALKSGLLPKWLCWEGIVGGLLVTLVLLRYVFPIFALAEIGYPLIVLYFTLTGIVLLRKINYFEGMDVANS